MSIDFMQIRSYLYNWAISNIPVGMPAIYYYPNAPRPTIDYVSLYISSLDQIGWDFDQAPQANDGIAEQVGDREFILQVQGYGGDPITVLNNLRTSLQKQSVLDTLRAVGIVFVSWFSINDITDLIDSRFEQRAVMDVKFRLADIYNDTPGVISSAQIQEIFEDSQQNIVYDETFIIPST